MRVFINHLLLSLAGLGVIAVVLCGVVFLSIGFSESPHPSDQKLESNFSKNEADFDLLIRMARADARVVRIASNFTWLDTNAAWPRPQSELGFSNERWEEYRRLFGKLGLSGGILNYQPESVMLVASSKGLVTGGSSKGYSYSVKEPPHLVASLENVSFKDSRIAYKRIKGNWYLFYLVS